MIFEEKSPNVYEVFAIIFGLTGAIIIAVTKRA